MSVKVREISFFVWKAFKATILVLCCLHLKSNFTFIDSNIIEIPKYTFLYTKRLFFLFFFLLLQKYVLAFNSVRKMSHSNRYD